MAMTGSWTVFFSWGCGTAYSTFPATFAAGGTWSGGGFSGNWSETQGMVMFNFVSGPAIYAGNVAGNVVAGTNTTFSGLTGCWYAKKSGVTPLTASKQTADAAGVKKGAKKSAKKKR